MKPKTLILLLLAAVVAAALAWWAINSGDIITQGRHDLKLGQRLFPDIAVADMTRLEVRGPGLELDLHRGDQRWRVDSYHGYPADPAKVLSLLTALSNVKPRLVIGDPGDIGLAPFSLLDPDAETGAGTRIRVFDAQDREMLAVIMGKANDPESGLQSFDSNFMRLPGSDEVFVDLTLIAPADRDPEMWIDHRFIEISDPLALQSRRGDELDWALRRDSIRGQWRPDFDIPPGLRFSPSRGAEVVEGLLRMTFADVLAPAAADAASADFSLPRVLHVETAAGPVYTLTFGAKRKMDGQYPLRIALDWPNRPEPTRQTQDLHTRYDRESSIFSDWIYVVPTYVADRLVYSSDTVLVKTRQEDPTGTLPDQGEVRPVPPDGSGSGLDDVQPLAPDAPAPSFDDPAADADK